VSERVVNARGVHVEVVKMTSLWAIFEFSRLYLGYNALAAREPVRAQEVREEGGEGSTFSCAWRGYRRGWPGFLGIFDQTPRRVLIRTGSN
jgi:hypothetical protein